MTTHSRFVLGVRWGPVGQVIGGLKALSKIARLDVQFIQSA